LTPLLRHARLHRSAIFPNAQHDALQFTDASLICGIQPGRKGCHIVGADQPLELFHQSLDGLQHGSGGEQGVPIGAILGVKLLGRAEQQEAHLAWRAVGRAQAEGTPLQDVVHYEQWGMHERSEWGKLAALLEEDPLD
ncbi:MAG: hypothetical protein M1298_04930, partial [Chloroflexi bacterium]|nr:hypothetical protein [Chloroflexota bacterium]